MMSLLANFTGELTLARSAYIVAVTVMKEHSYKKRNYKSLTFFKN